MTMLSRMSRELAHRIQVDARVCRLVLQGAADLVFEEWDRGRAVAFPGLGAFLPKRYGPRTVSGNLPGQAENRYRLPSRKVVRFRPALRFQTPEAQGGGVMTTTTSALPEIEWMFFSDDGKTTPPRPRREIETPYAKPMRKQYRDLPKGVRPPRTRRRP